MGDAEAAIAARVGSAAVRLDRIAALARYAGDRANDATLSRAGLEQAKVRLLLFEHLLGQLEREVPALAAQFARNEDIGRP